MARAGWDNPHIGYDGDADGIWLVEVYAFKDLADVMEGDRTFLGLGNTLGLAVANTYKDWQLYRRTK